MLTSTTTITALAELIVSEYDKAGTLKAKYIESEWETGCARIDVLVPPRSKTLGHRLLDVFLPDGYPHSVTDDYTQYQIYDSLQAFAGSIAGMISSRAVWEGIGVGDASASPTGAMLVTIVRECTGRFSTITFAHLLGTSIEAECKMYRLASDILCDTAMILDTLSPLFPPSIRFLMLCTSSGLFSVAGVTGNASKSSLTAHFALKNNFGELIAKDASQETAISLMGMIAGTFVVSSLRTPLTTWLSLLFLLGVHLIMNHQAVRAVKMRSLNRQRANILFSSLISYDKVLTPEQVSDCEVIFEERGGSVLRWSSHALLGHCEFGVSLKNLLASLPDSRRTAGSGSVRLGDVDLSTLMDLFQNQRYILWYELLASMGRDSTGSHIKVLVVLKEGATSQAQLKAWYHALLLAQRLSRPPKPSTPVAMKSQGHLGRSPHSSLAHVASTLGHADRTFDEYARRMKAAGWDLDIPALETRAGCRISVH